MSQDSVHQRASAPAVIHKAARGLLAREETIFPPRTRSPEVRQALARCAYGLAHYEGEHVVACAPLSGSGKAFEGLIFTDRALLSRFGDERHVLPWEQLRDLEHASGFLTSSLKVKGPEGLVIELPIDDRAKEIEAFLRRLIEVRYRPGPRAVPAATISQDDPTGVKHLVASLKEPDKRVVGLCQLLFEGVDAERISVEAGQDLCARLHVLHRTLEYGRGGTELGWLSPLRRDDLAALVLQLFPDREITREGRQRGLELEIHLKPRDKKAPRRGQSIEDRVISSLINRVVEKTVGQEIYSLIGQEPDSVRVLIEEGQDTETLLEGEGQQEGDSVWQILPSLADRFLGRNKRAEDGALTCYGLEGYVARQYLELATLNPAMVSDFNRRLLPLEVRALTLRALHGWAMAPEALFAITDAQLHQSLSKTIPSDVVQALLSPLE